MTAKRMLVIDHGLPSLLSSRNNDFFGQLRLAPVECIGLAFFRKSIRVDKIVTRGKRANTKLPNMNESKAA